MVDTKTLKSEVGVPGRGGRTSHFMGQRRVDSYVS